MVKTARTTAASRTAAVNNSRIHRASLVKEKGEQRSVRIGVDEVLVDTDDFGPWVGGTSSSASALPVTARVPFINRHTLLGGA